ncbi:MAG: protein kinase [Acidobacteria bacterium]|nr:protein kinase [Acidobacteriota bacterium]
MRTKLKKLGAGVCFAVLLSAVFALGGVDWYSYYEKAELARLKKDYASALRYYAEAIAQRPEPGRNLATYGLNRLETYYPYLGAAQCAFELTDYAKCDELLKEAERYGIEPAGAVETLRTKLIAARPAQTAELPPQSAGAPPVTTTESRPGSAVVPTPPMATQPSTVTPPATNAHPPTGAIRVKTTPPGATVLIDGRPKGKSDLTVGKLAAGTHELRLELSEFEPYVTQVLVAAGQVTPQDVILNEIVRSGRQEKAPQAPPPASIGQPAKSREGTGTPIGHDASRPEGGTVESPAVPGTAVPRRDGSSGLIWITAAGALVLGAVLMVWVISRMRAARRRGDFRLAQYTISPTFPIQATPPQAFGDFQIVRHLGHGGMSNVYLARDQKSTPVALKVLHRHLFETPTVRERFLREADLGRTLHHPNIVTIHGGGCVEDAPYIVMEYVEGENLKQKLLRERKLPPEVAVEIIIKVVEALDYAHLKGVIHRDLKPANILITNSGAVKVMDYGIARAISKEGLTATGAFMGTPAYMAPETTGAKPVDHKSDLYSVGVILFELLTGCTPFASDSPFALIERHRVDPPPPLRSIDPSMPASLERVILKLLEKDPEKRHGSAEELINELRGIAEELRA